MAYRYDAFFSYRRNALSDAWHETVKNQLEFWLTQELGQSNVSIFLDKEDIHSGDRWREKIADALLHSRSLICIWSPNYFRSKWCVSEWHTFQEREKQLAGTSLIVPARFHDGTTYPPAARDRQSADFTMYASTMEAFWRTEKAVEFENSLQTFAVDVAAAIRQAPDYDAGFPLVEANSDVITAAPVIHRPGETLL